MLNPQYHISCNGVAALGGVEDSDCFQWFLEIFKIYLLVWERMAKFVGKIKKCNEYEIFF